MDSKLEAMCFAETLEHAMWSKDVMWSARVPKPATRNRHQFGTQVTARKEKRQAFGIPKAKRTIVIIKQNSKTPLFKLPSEVRKQIWGYVLGHQLVHVHKILLRAIHVPNFRELDIPWPTRQEWSYTICQSTITEQAAYELFKSEKYDVAASTMKAEQDLRHCESRHALCYAALKEADQEQQPAPNRLQLDILSVCRQAYTEAMHELWTTTTWSFYKGHDWTVWLKSRKLLQRKLMRDVHLAPNLVYWGLNMNTIARSIDWPWRRIYVNISVKLHSSKIRRFFPADEIYVICSGDNHMFSSDLEGSITDNADLSWHGRSAIAQTMENTLFNVIPETKSKVEKIKAKAKGRKRRPSTTAISSTCQKKQREMMEIIQEDQNNWD